MSDANQDKLAGKLKEFGGKAEQAVGDATDDQEMKGRGEAREAEGKGQNLAGKVKDAVGDAADGVKGAFDHVTGKDKDNK